MFNFIKKWTQSTPENKCVIIDVRGQCDTTIKEQTTCFPIKKYKTKKVYELTYELGIIEIDIDNKNCIRKYFNNYKTENRDEYLKKIEHINDLTKENYNILTVNGGVFTCLNIGIDHEDHIVFPTKNFHSLRYINNETDVLEEDEEPTQCSPQI